MHAGRGFHVRSLSSWSKLPQLAGRTGGNPSRLALVGEIVVSACNAVVQGGYRFDTNFLTSLSSAAARPVTPDRNRPAGSWKQVGTSETHESRGQGGARVKRHVQHIDVRTLFLFARKFDAQAVFSPVIEHSGGMWHELMRLILVCVNCAFAFFTLCIKYLSRVIRRVALVS